MKIAILGSSGRMGKVLIDLSKTRNHQVMCFDKTSASFPAKADVFIDFSHFSATAKHVEKICQLQKPLVLGTTGWEKEIKEIEKIVKNYQGKVVYGGNFSLAVNIFWSLLAEASRQFSKFSDQFDVFGSEIHHRFKVDSPSGTAKQAGKIIMENFPSKKKIVDSKLDGAIEKEQLHIASLRGGDFCGFHEFYFDGQFETVKISCNSKVRTGFALGAILCAEKINQLPAGFYNFKEIFTKIF